MVVGPADDDRPSGRLRRRRHGAGRAHRHVAVGHGKKAARYIDAWLRGDDVRQAGRAPSWSPSRCCTCRCSATPIRRCSGDLPDQDRMSGFDEVLAGLTRGEARHEAQRCLSCGNCFECDNCYAACPEQAIVKLGPGRGYSVDDATCTGCAICFEQCPVPCDRDGRRDLPSPIHGEASSDEQRAPRWTATPRSRMSPTG